jgi:hypothetical protein
MVLQLVKPALACATQYQLRFNLRCHENVQITRCYHYTNSIACKDFVSNLNLIRNQSRVYLIILADEIDSLSLSLSLSLSHTYMYIYI